MKNIHCITYAGKTTEQRVLDIVASSRDNKDQSSQGRALGDIIVTCDNKDYYVEVKKTTWNQTRPYKYITVVGYDVDNDLWFVISPDDLLREVRYRNGQHTKNPFICVGLGNVNKKKSWKKYSCQSEDLESAIHDAIRKGEKNTKLKHVAKVLREKEIKRVAEDRKMVIEAAANCE